MSTTKTGISGAAARVDTTATRIAAAIPALAPVLYARDQVLARARARLKDDAGLGLVELVMITAIVASMVIAITVILRDKLEGEANELNFDTSTVG